MRFADRIDGLSQRLALDQYLVRWEQRPYASILRELAAGRVGAEVVIQAQYITLVPPVLAQAIEATCARIRFALQELTQDLRHDLEGLLSPPVGALRVVLQADLPTDDGGLQRSWAQLGAALPGPEATVELLRSGQPPETLSATQWAQELGVAPEPAC